VKKSEINNSRDHCKKTYECWQWDYMIKHKFSTEDMYKVCRKCMYFKPQTGGTISKEELERIMGDK